MAHMRVFNSLAYAMDVNEKRFNAKHTKCLFLRYCEGMESYRQMCLETK